MKPDVLERLLMDQALGHLEPDVEALLADFLADNSATTVQAQELQATVQLATKAVRSPVPVAEMPIQIHRFIWRHRAEQVLALAASFMVGVGITALLLQANSHQEVVATSHKPPTAVASARLIQAESLPFWSTQRAYLLASTKTEYSK
jgi:hypothetical protein